MHKENPQPNKLHLADVALEQRWKRMRPTVYVPLDFAWAVGLWALWASGYPAWRVVAVAAALVLLVAVQAIEVWRSRAGHEAAAAARGTTDGVSFALVFLSVAVTGGLASPLLVMLVASVPGLMVQHGWSKRTKRRVGLINLGALALALVPDGWVGPALTGRPHLVATATAIAMFGMSVTHFLGVLLGAANTSIRDAFRARDEIADNALARARDLEHIGAQLSHELKNPLGAIKALVQLSLRAPAESRERLEVIEGEVQRMQGILQDYLSFARPLEKLQRQRVSLAMLADESLASLEARATQAGVRLRRRGDARVDADPRRVKEALINLVANALEASPSGGEVEVEIDERDGLARLEVRDSGRGMAPQVLEKLGTPFFTTREDGTGLGVALARATFTQHGGGLEYRSAPGQGTTACASLPVPARRSRDVASAGSR